MARGAKSERVKVRDETLMTHSVQLYVIPLAILVSHFGSHSMVSNENDVKFSQTYTPAGGPSVQSSSPWSFYFPALPYSYCTAER